MVEGGDKQPGPFDPIIPPAPQSIIPPAPQPIIPPAPQSIIPPAPQSITLSGATADVSMFAFPGTQPPAQPTGFRWGQYFVGITIPVVFLVIFSIFADLSNDRSDPYSYQIYELEEDSDGYFSEELTLETATTEISWCYTYSTVLEISCESFSQDESSASVIDYTDGYPGVQIGEFTGSNSTLWFKPLNNSESSITMEVSFYDPSIDTNGPDIAFGLLGCSGMLAYLVGIVVAFVKGKKALAYGLLTPLLIFILLMSVLFALLIFAFSQF